MRSAHVVLGTQKRLPEAGLVDYEVYEQPRVQGVRLFRNTAAVIPNNKMQKVTMINVYSHDLLIGGHRVLSSQHGSQHRLHTLDAPFCPLVALRNFPDRLLKLPDATLSLDDSMRWLLQLWPGAAAEIQRSLGQEHCGRGSHASRARERAHE